MVGKCVLLEDPVVSCLAYSSSLGVREAADTRVFSNGIPLPLHHVTCVGWPSCTTARSLVMGLFCKKWKHSTCTHSLTSEPMQCHMFTCHFPFCQYSQGEQCVGCQQPQQPYRLSGWTCTAELGQQLTLLVSKPHRLPLVPPPCCRKWLQHSWRNTPECLHDLVPECLSWSR